MRMLKNSLISMETKMCILNGSVHPENDNFTCVRTISRSVVDCICTFHDNLSNCKLFMVHLTRPLLDSLNVFERVIPDYSILELVFIPHFRGPNTNDWNNDADQSTNNNSSQNIQQQNNINDECTSQYFKRYKIRNMPVNVLNSNIAREAILQCIDNIRTLKASQQEVDKMYENVCNVYYKEMDLWFKWHNVNSVSKKKFRNSSKPFWNDELTQIVEKCMYSRI